MSTSGVIGTIAISVVVTAGVAAQAVRWLRVLQREHYEPGAASRFRRRWFNHALTNPLNSSTTRATVTTLLGLAFVAGAVLVVVAHGDGALAAGLGVAALITPWRLTLRGRTGRLVWTRRLSTVAIVTTLLSAAFALTAVTSVPWVGAALLLVAMPLVVDAAALITRPYEDHRAAGFVRQASERLSRVSPTVVAITGSFGKTSTKHHLAELLGGRHGVVPTPRSFNNRAGLSRAINENVIDGTRYFIAEMGTYGSGEISDLTSWCTPDIAVVTSIGPVHLERMGTMEAIERAKYEITALAPLVVLNVDDQRLRNWVPRLQSEGKRVVTAGSVHHDAMVQVAEAGERWQISVNGVVAGIAPPVVGIHATNLACAIAVALELGVSIEEIVGRLTHLTTVPNRMVVATSPSGVMVIDDTFNANPSGAASALATLGALPVNGRRLVVTPGIIELGMRQHIENETLGREVRELGADLAVVGRTNRVALEAGYGAIAQRFATRESAVEWVRATLRAGDGVLYLNDLPDHYP